MNERVVSFLYVLMRDHLVPGVVEGIMQNNVEPRDRVRKVNGRTHQIMHDKEPLTFSNKGLEQYAREIAGRLHV